MGGDINKERTGVASYVACCLVALLCWATVGYTEVLILQQQTDAKLMLIERAVEQLEKVARK